MRVKVTEWPKVLPDDHGIRPAGRRNRCFYCDRKVGQLHKEDCCVVSQLVTYEVYASEELVGTFTRLDPHYWDALYCNWHKNESTWCADNALDDIKWKDEGTRLRVMAMLAGQDCACRILRFEFKESDEGPYIERPDDVSAN